MNWSKAQAIGFSWLMANGMVFMVVGLLQIIGIAMDWVADGVIDFPIIKDWMYRCMAVLFVLTSTLGTAMFYWAVGE